MVSAPTFTLLRTREALEDYSRKLRKALASEKEPRFLYDWETEKDDDRFRRFGVLLAVYHPVAGSVSIPLGCADPRGPMPSFDDLWATIGRFLGDADIGKVTHGGIFDRQVCRLHGFEVAYSSLDRDSLIQSWLLDPDGDHDLASLGDIYQTKHKKLHKSVLELLRQFKVKQISQIPIDALAEYAEGDNKATFDLSEILMGKISEMQLLPALEQEMRYRPNFDNLSWRGAPVDQKRVRDLHIKYESLMRKVEKRIYKIAGEPFNIASNAQLKAVLLDKMGLEPLGDDGKIKLTKGGKSGNRQPSVDGEVLENMAVRGAKIAEEILLYRSYAKLDGTYLVPYLEIGKRDGRVHADFNQTGTGTGRPSSSNPNLQNIPRPDTDAGSEGMAIRSCFKAPKGHTLIAGDYSQIEPRLLAELSEDVALTKVFSVGGDIYMEIVDACGILPRVGGDVKKARPLAKIIQLGVSYGMREYLLAKNLRCSVDESRNYLARYYKRFYGVSYYRATMVSLARRFGYLRTLAGRIRRIADIQHPEDWRRRHAENQCINTPIQGGVADILKRALYELELARSVFEKKGAEIILQVHDEIVVSCKPKDVKPVMKELESVMIDSAKIWMKHVPVKVGSKSGVSWDLCK